MENVTAPVIEKIPGDFMHEPYRLYARLRREGPAREVVMPNGVKVWMVTGYDDVRTILTHPRISKDGRRINELFARHSGATEVPAPSYDDELSAHMLNSDPPRHERLRKLVGKAFTLRRVDLLRPRVERIADALLDRMAGGQRADLICDYAMPLPITVITELLGVPVEDRETFRLRASTLVGSHHSADEVEAASVAVIDYAGRLIVSKRSSPGDDLLSAMVQARADGDQLTVGELVAMVFLLVAAGHETTMSTLGNAIHSLLRNPDQLAKLRANPDLLTTTAFEELVRYDPGVSLATFRFTTAPIPLAGVTIPAGEIVVVALGSAGRDARRYADADRLDLTRRINGGLAFGKGIHYCIGAPLGRMEVEIAIGRLIARFPDMRLAVEPSELRWKSSNLMHGLLALPVMLGRQP
jgi:cytochrome P450